VRSLGSRDAGPCRRSRCKTCRNTCGRRLRSRRCASSLARAAGGRSDVLPRATRLGLRVLSPAAPSIGIHRRAFTRARCGNATHPLRPATQALPMPSESCTAAEMAKYNREARCALLCRPSDLTQKRLTPQRSPSARAPLTVSRRRRLRRSVIALADRSSLSWRTFAQPVRCAHCAARRTRRRCASASAAGPSSPRLS
jgi:hypothetical protein